MKYTILGRTGLKVSKAGLGCGGHSRIGLSKNLGENNAISIINTAFNLGVNIFDTSSVYGTEDVLGKALLGVDRSSYVISTKFPPSSFSNDIKPAASLTESLDESLSRLKTDYIDILHLHAVQPEVYIDVRDRFMPELIKAKEAGKIGWFGITEMFGKDTNHSMLQQAVQDDLWDVVMTGLNILNFSAVKTVLPMTQKNNIGTLLMFAVRNTLSKHERLIEVINELNNNGEIDISLFDIDSPLNFLTQNATTSSIVDAAYRFCANTYGIDVVLSGTASKDHLKSNINSILSDRLSDDVLNKIYKLFNNVDSVSGQ